MIEIIVVWLAFSSSAGRTYVQAEHLTEERCLQDIAERVEQPEAWPRYYCQRGLRRIVVSPPLPDVVDRPSYRTTTTKYGTCTGDDRFCGR